MAILDLLNTHPLWGVGVMLIVGYAFGKVSERFGLPEITGFIVAGILIGPQGLSILNSNSAQGLAVVTEIALAFLAFTVGGSLQKDILLRVGRAIVLISFTHILTTAAFVTIALLVVGIHPAVAVLLGVISGASSPGTTVALVRREQASGPFVEYLFGVIAVVNAVVIIIFGLVFAFAPRMLGLPGEANLLFLVGSATSSVGLAIFLGLLTGFGVRITTRSARQPAARTIILVTGLLLMGTSVGIALGLSPLLINMTAGATFVNSTKRSESVFRILEPLTPPIYALFFVLAGTKFQLDAFTGGALLMYGAVYILSRLTGVYCGVRLGAWISKVSNGIGRNVGWCLVPQAGVALGLVLLIEAYAARGNLPPGAATTLQQAVNIVLMAIFVKEIVGPVIASAGLRRGIRDTAA